MNRHEERRRRKLDRQKRRREGAPQPRMNGNARVLAIVGASEVDADASITSHPPAGVN